MKKFLSCFRTLCKTLNCGVTITLAKMERLGRKAIQTAKQQAVKTDRRHKEDERTVKVTVRMPEDLVKALKHKAIDEGKTFQDLVTEAVRKFLGR